MNTTTTNEAMRAARLARVLTYVYENNLVRGLETADHYKEPGYDDPESRVIVFGNWNPGCGYSRRQLDGTYAPVHESERERDPHVRAGRILERLGADVHWADEWATCGQCGGAVRTAPDSYSWRGAFIMTDGGIDCKECLLEDPEAYVQDFLLNRSESADTFAVDLSALGFSHVETDESGLHPWQNGDPVRMANELVPEGHDFAFQIDAVGQFDAQFSLWIRPEDYESEDYESEDYESED